MMENNIWLKFPLNSQFQGINLTNIDLFEQHFIPFQLVLFFKTVQYLQKIRAILTLNAPPVGILQVYHLSQAPRL